MGWLFRGHVCNLFWTPSLIWNANIIYPTLYVACPNTSHTPPHIGTSQGPQKNKKEAEKKSVPGYVGIPLTIHLIVHVIFQESIHQLIISTAFSLTSWGLHGPSPPRRFNAISPTLRPAIFVRRVDEARRCELPTWPWLIPLRPGWYPWKMCLPEGRYNVRICFFSIQCGQNNGLNHHFCRCYSAINHSQMGGLQWFIIVLATLLHIVHIAV